MLASCKQTTEFVTGHRQQVEVGLGQRRGGLRSAYFASAKLFKAAGHVNFPLSRSGTGAAEKIKHGAVWEEQYSLIRLLLHCYVPVCYLQLLLEI